jgi:uncharacterized cupredoxin-like copper-binding protein
MSISNTEASRMSRPTIRLATAVIAAGLLAAATAGAALAQSPTAPMASGAAPRVIAMEIGTGSIEPASVEVLRGETVTFEATNVSDTEVELIVGLASEVAADDGASLAEAEHIAPGTMKPVDFTFDGDGPYAYGDQLPGHYAAGAKGDIVLVDQLSVPSPAASPAGRVVAVTISAGAIDPATVEVTKGETVTFEATNASNTEVELIVGLASEVAADDGASLAEAEHIAPGTMKSVDFTFDGDGPYAYGDQLPGHYAAGARGDIVLK